MRSRIAVLAVLTVGVLFASAGAALGANALSTDTNSSSQQYGSQAVKPAVAPAAVKPAVAPAVGVGAVNAAQAPRQYQAAAGPGDELPFTGYGALSILFIGVALLGGGLVLRRRANGLPGQQ